MKNHTNDTYLRIYDNKMTEFRGKTDLKKLFVCRFRTDLCNFSPIRKSLGQNFSTSFLTQKQLNCIYQLNNQNNRVSHNSTLQAAIIFVLYIGTVCIYAVFQVSKDGANVFCDCCGALSFKDICSSQEQVSSEM